MTGDLAAAGRAGLDAWFVAGGGAKGDTAYMANAQAVLDALGIKLDGWEWRATGEVRGFPFGSPGAVEDFARAWAEKSGGTVQRRRVTSTEWETVK